MPHFGCLPIISLEPTIIPFYHSWALRGYADFAGLVIVDILLEMHSKQGSPKSIIHGAY